MRVLPDFLRYDDIPALALFLDPRRQIHGRAEVIEYVIQVHGDARAMVNADFER